MIHELISLLQHAKTQISQGRFGYVNGRAKDGAGYVTQHQHSTFDFV